jgi:hypothetical protein
LGRWRLRTTLLAVVVVIAAAASVVVDAEIDVPEWANVPGVDLPFVGDDPLRCDVVAATGGVRIELAGDSDSIDDYRHVWVNGVVVEGLELQDRRAELSFEDDDVVHLAVSPTRQSDSRFWCGSASRSEGILER